MKTLAIQRTINVPGALFPGRPLCILEDGLLPSIGLKTEVPKIGYKKLQYLNQICLWGPTRSRLAGPDPLLFKF